MIQLITQNTNRSNLIWLFVASVGCNPLLAQGGKNQNASEPRKGDIKPLNIVYIMSDDHSYQTISCYDNRFIRTPNIDGIAANGVRFTNSFVANSISGPSRACMLTGKFSHKNGMTTNATRFDSTQVTFPKLLQNAGYQTAIFGKWHLKSEPSGFDKWEILVGQGQYYDPIFITPTGRVTHKGYSTTVITDLTLDWMENERDRERPFCLVIHHKAPHRNWMPDTGEIDLFEDVTFPLPETFYDDYKGRPAAAAQEMSIAGDEMDFAFDLKLDSQDIQTRLKENLTFALRRLDSTQRFAWNRVYDSVLKDFKMRNLKGRELAEWKYQRYMKDYLKCIRSVDDNIGRVMEYLKENNLLENTIVIYTSDQGFYMGEHGWFDKRFMYEESLRTPLVVQLPTGRGDFSKRGDVDLFVQNIDYAPTILELAGVEVPGDIQGESFVPLLRGEKPRDWRKSIYYHYFEYPAEHAVRRHYGVRDSRYKLIKFYGHDIDAWELYDLKEDPKELNNVFDNPGYKNVTKSLLRELKRLMKKYEDSEEITVVK
ncbi:MAG: sulfatase [Bacteroidales bacterium]|nr:sulfatase [Bacteroidales bacterium]